jgi:DNA segregation ATPase FtsK/SpoIIIE-like protein
MAVDASAYVSLDAAQSALKGSLSRLRVWVRVVLAIRFATIGVAVGAGAMAMVRGYDRLWGVTWPAETALYPLLTACGAAALVAVIWPLPDRLMAASADRRLGLWDRLTTAVELSDELYPTGMQRAQIFDAIRRLGDLSAIRAYPVRFDRMTKVMLGCLAALAVVQFAPIPALLLSEREQEERAELKIVAQELEPAVEQLKDQADEADDEETEEAAERLERLTQRMERGRVTKREALLELSELEEKLDRLDREIDRPSLKTARQTAQEIGERGREEMAEKAEKLAERARQQGDSQLEKRMQEAAEKARKAQSASEMREIGSELERAAAQTGTKLAPTAMLDAVSVALENEEWDEALNSLEDLQEMLSGDDLELTKEQAEELAKRMEELAEKLKDTELSEMSECLKKAAECMRQGDCKGAAQCLGQAAKAGRSGLGAAKLGKGVSEMRAAADRAAASLRRPGAAQSQGGQGGVGPDDGSQTQVPPNADGAALYAPRENPMDVDPEQVRSGVRPGGEAYATPTRGAPDRVDESRVPYYEVIGDYSRAAEDALEREEVPPAYRATVREYFDSLQGGAEADGDE